MYIHIYLCMGMHISILKYVFGKYINVCRLKQEYLLIYQTGPPWLNHLHQTQHRHHKAYRLARRDVQAPHVVGE